MCLNSIHSIFNERDFEESQQNAETVSDSCVSDYDTLETYAQSTEEEQFSVNTVDKTAQIINRLLEISSKYNISKVAIDKILCALNQTFALQLPQTYKTLLREAEMDDANFKYQFECRCGVITEIAKGKSPLPKDYKCSACNNSINLKDLLTKSKF